MPEGIFTPESGRFEYITLDDLRAEDISEEYVSDDRARMYIGYVSQWINKLTRQWFLPVRLNERMDGRHAAVCPSPYFIPILRLDAIVFFKENLIQTTLPSVAYVRKDRYVQMMSFGGRFPNPPRFIQLQGVFGWLTEDYYISEMLLTSPLSFGDTNVLVSGLTKRIRKGDAVLLGDNPWPASMGVEVKDVDYANNTLLIDPSPIDLPVNSKVSRFGRIPPLIKRAALLLVMDKGAQLAWSEQCTPYFAKRLTNESVEGYSYGLAQLPAPYGAGGGEWTTGNPEVDDILAQYCANRFYVGAV